MDSEMAFSWWGYLAKMSGSLAVVIGLLWSSLWLYKQVGKKRHHFGLSSRIINVVERRQLSPKSSLFVVELAGKKVLIGDSAAGITYLTPIEEIGLSDKSFAEVLEKKMAPEAE